MCNPNVRCHVYELGELFWEHDLLVLRSLNDVQRRAQCRARERLYRHARLAQDLLRAGQLPALSEPQGHAVDGMADLTQQLWDHARAEDTQVASPVHRARLPIPAPASIWHDRTYSSTAPTVPAKAAAPHTAAMVCRRCRMDLVRTELATALGRPSTQGWLHADGRKTHLPDPVPARSGGTVGRH